MIKVHIIELTDENVVFLAHKLVGIVTVGIIRSKNKLGLLHYVKDIFDIIFVWQNQKRKTMRV